MPTACEMSRPEEANVLLLGTVLMALVLVGCVIAISRPGTAMGEAERDAPDMGLPDDRPMTADDVDEVRFSLAWRGYRMADVDLTLDRLRVELATRDARIRQLEADARSGVPTAVDVEPPSARPETRPPS
jgi:DivIVA domain-containing protein